MDKPLRTSIAKAAGLIGFFTLLSRLLGFYRDRLFGTYFGLGDIRDAYNAAFLIPDIIFNLLVLGTLSAAFVPVFTEYFSKDKEEATNVANTILNACFLVILALCGILILFVPQLVHLAYDFTGEKYEHTVALTRILLLSPIIFTVSNVFSSMLYTWKRFLWTSLAPIMYNLGIIFGIIVFYPKYGIEGLAYGVILGALLHMLIQAPIVFRSGFRFRPVLKLRHPAIREFTKLFVPRIIGVDVSQISLLIGGIIASSLATGTISAFIQTNNLQAVAVGIFGIPFALAAFPNLAQSFAERDERQFSATVQRTMLHVLYFVVPLSVLLYILRFNIMTFFQSGEFGRNEVIVTANTLGIFAFSMFAQSLAPLFSRAFYAPHNTLTPVLINAGCLVVNAVLAYTLAPHIGVYGLAVAFASATILNAIALFVVLQKHISFFNRAEVLQVVGQILVSAGATILVAYTALYVYAAMIPNPSVLHVLLQGVVAGILGSITYILVSARLGVPEGQHLMKVVKRIVFR